MPIVVRLDVMLAQRKMRSKDLAEAIGITEANVSLLKSGKVRGVRFDTLARICAVLDCQPGDLLVHEPGPQDGMDLGSDEADADNGPMRGNGHAPDAAAGGSIRKTLRKD